MHAYHAFLINENKILSSLLYEYNFTFSLFCVTHKLVNDKNIFKKNFYI